MILRVTLPHCLAKRSGQAKKNIIILIIAIAVAGFSVYYATAGIFKTNTQVVNDLTSGLVGYWTFDGQDMDWSQSSAEVRDQSGYGSHGNVINGATPIAGKVGQALDFDGIDDRMSIGSTVPLGNSSSFSHSIWVYLDGSQNNLARVFTEDFGYGMSGSLNLRYEMKNASETSKYVDSSPDLTPNRWTHVTVVYNITDDTLYMYIDGEFSASTPSIGGLSPAHFDNTVRFASIGGVSWSPNYQFDGSIDEVRVYNRALSVSEIKELYNQGAKRLTKTNINQKTEIVGDGLVGYWTFDGQDTDWGTNTVNDMSGNSNTGTMTNMSTTTSPVEGVVGQALEFDGTDNAVNTGDPAILDLTSAITVSAWIYPDEEGAGQGGISVKKGGGSMGWKMIYEYDGSNCDDNEINFRFGNADDCSSVIARNKWSHVVATVDASSYAFYVNGAVDFSDTGTYSSSSSSGYDNCVGAAGTTCNSSFFNGKIDEVRVYDRALSANEIKELYNQGAEKLLKINMPQTDLIPNGLVGYWTFDGQDTDWGANTTNDLSGNNNTGTMTNMSTTTSPVEGVVGQALDFDGDDDYIVVDDSASLNMVNALTVSMWIRTETVMSTWTTPLIKSSMVADGYGFFVRGGLNFFVNDIDYGVAFFPTPSAGKWHHIVGTYDSSDVRIYVNGVEGTPMSYSTSIGTVNVDLFLGGSVVYLDGKLDEVRIYNRALSASEVKELYMAGVGK